MDGDILRDVSLKEYQLRILRVGGTLPLDLCLDGFSSSPTEGFAQLEVPLHNVSRIEAGHFQHSKEDGEEGKKSSVLSGDC